MKYHSFNQVTLIGRVDSIKEVDFSNGTKTFLVGLASWRYFLKADGSRGAHEEIHRVTIPRIKRHSEFVLKVFPNSLLFVQGPYHIRKIPSNRYVDKVTGTPLMTTFWDVYADIYIPLGGEEENETVIETIARQSKHGTVNPEHLRLRDPGSGMG